KLQHVLGDQRVGLGGLRTQEVKASRSARRLQAPNRATQQAVGQLRRKVVGQARMTVAGDDHLLAFGHERVQGVQEFDVSRPLLRQEMQVIEQEDVQFAEVLAECGEFAGPQRLHEAIGEILGSYVNDSRVRELFADAGI